MTPKPTYARKGGEECALREKARNAFQLCLAAPLVPREVHAHSGVLKEELAKDDRRHGNFRELWTPKGQAVEKRVGVSLRSVISVLFLGNFGMKYKYVLSSKKMQEPNPYMPKHHRIGNSFTST